MNVALPTDIADMVGPVAVREFNAAADHYKPNLITWARNLATLDDNQFMDEAASAIYDSALTSSFRGNWEHEHFKATACFAEANRRHRSAGHDQGCQGETLYGRAHARVMEDNGHKPGRPGACTCHDLTVDER